MLCGKKAAKALLFLGIGALGALSAKGQRETSSLPEAKVADMAGFLVYSSPAVWDALVLISHTQSISPSSMVKTAQDLVKENTPELKKIIEKKERLSESLAGLLHRLSKEYDKRTPKKNKLFQMDTSEQAIALQKKCLDNTAQKLSLYSTGEEVLLRQYLQVLLSLPKKESTQVWNKYKDVIYNTQAAMAKNIPVKSALFSLVKEFNLYIEGLVNKTNTQMGSFNLEKARFNLGGSIYTPGALLQISTVISQKPYDPFLKQLVSSLLLPLQSLKASLQDASPEEVKSEIIRFIHASSGEISAYPLKSEIDKAYNLRSESICMYTKKFPHPKERTLKIDENQTERTQQMLEILQHAPSSQFKNFFLLDSNLTSLYTDLVLNNSGDVKRKKEIQEKFDLL
ncbi:hypothetical protein NECID01_1072 [Nematocida sp. AWRm77]|nr:hypothetical protein NECID01_1072 [Nematocida sp. AWRm77]